MKYYIFLLLLPLIYTVQGQVPVSSYVIAENPPASSAHVVAGWTEASSPYSSSETYNVLYGRTDVITTGLDRSVTSFIIASGPSSGTFIPILYSTDKPFDTVIVKRIDNATATGRRVNALYEIGSFTSVSNSLYLQPSYSATMEDLVNTRFINIGSDNTFVNDAATTNNIERFDMIFSKGIGAATADLSKVGILINERGGNDYFKIAAIKGIDSSKNVTALGNLISVTPSDWGNSLTSINTVVMSKEESDLYLRPKQDISSQPISGVFISLLQLGISGDSLIKGVSLFPNDVTAANDLIGLSDVSTTTSGGAVGGLDLMAGGGFFREDNTLFILPVQFISFTGRLINDQQARLNWIAYNDDIDPGKYFIERSQNGSAWTTIGQVDAISQNGTQVNYSFTDYGHLASINYYRIQYKSLDGRMNFTKTIGIVSGKKEEARLYYNPGSGNAFIHTGNYGGQFTIQLYDLAGRLISDHKYQQGPQSLIEYDVNGIPNGLFILHVLNDQKRILGQKLLK